VRLPPRCRHRPAWTGPLNSVPTLPPAGGGDKRSHSRWMPGRADWSHTRLEREPSGGSCESLDLGGSVGQPNHIFSNSIAGHEVEWRPRAGEEWLAATQHNSRGSTFDAFPKTLQDVSQRVRCAAEAEFPINPDFAGGTNIPSQFAVIHPEWADSRSRLSFVAQGNCEPPQYLIIQHGDNLAGRCRGSQVPEGTSFREWIMPGKVIRWAIAKPRLPAGRRGRIRGV
jgi:hypothetical protein